MGNQGPVTHVIEVRVKNSNDPHPDKSRLELDGKDHIIVNAGDTVQWVIEDPRITSILVMDDNKRDNVFSPDPCPDNPGKPGSSWSGKIAPNAQNKSESYSICWTQGEITYCYDPQIHVNT